MFTEYKHTHIAAAAAGSFLFCLFEVCVCVELKTSQRKPQDETSDASARVRPFFIYCLFKKEENIKVMHCLVVVVDFISL